MKQVKTNTHTTNSDDIEEEDLDELGRIALINQHKQKNYNNYDSKHDDDDYDIPVIESKDQDEENNVDKNIQNVQNNEFVEKEKDKPFVPKVIRKASDDIDPSTPTTRIRKTIDEEINNVRKSHTDLNLLSPESDLDSKNDDDISLEVNN